MATARHEPRYLNQASLHQQPRLGICYSFVDLTVTSPVRKSPMWVGALKANSIVVLSITGQRRPIRIMIGPHIPVVEELWKPVPRHHRMGNIDTLQSSNATTMSKSMKSASSQRLEPVAWVLSVRNPSRHFRSGQLVGLQTYRIVFELPNLKSSSNDRFAV